MLRQASLKDNTTVPTDHNTEHVRETPSFVRKTCETCLFSFDRWSIDEQSIFETVEFVNPIDLSVTNVKVHQIVSPHYLDLEMALDLMGNSSLPSFVVIEISTPMGNWVMPSELPRVLIITRNTLNADWFLFHQLP